MSTIQQHYAQIIQKLSEHGIESPDLEARIILKHRCNAEWADIMATPERPIDETHAKLIESDLARRIAGEPLARIHGTREFYGLEFALGPDTLEPRPDTEILIDRALKLFPVKQFPARILDLGTGTGCIIVTLLKHWLETRGVAVDIAQGALDIARQNAEAHGVSDRLELVRSNWADSVTGQFDLIVSNPPYIPAADIPNLAKEVRNHDPILALDGGFDGFDAYKKIFSALNTLLKPGGIALFEIGIGQEEGIARLGRESRIRVKHTQADYAGITRVVEISNGDN